MYRLQRLAAPIAPALFPALLGLAAPALSQTVFPTTDQLDESLYFLRHIEIVDIDGDGHLDVLAVNGADPRMSVYPGDGQGEFGRPVFLEPLMETVDGLIHGDFDGDGLNDFVAVVEDGQNERAILFRNLGDYAFDRIPVGSWEYEADEIGAEDFDGDGDLDFIYSVNRAGIPPSRSGIFVRAFDGTGFEPTTRVLTLDRASSFQSVDVNGDGRCDVVMRSIADDAWRLSTSLGPAGFSVPRSVFPASVSSLPGLQLADIDQDGTLDILAVAPANERLLYVLLGQGLLDFAAPIAIPTSRDPHLHPEMVRDYDGDGVMDLTFGNNPNPAGQRSIMRGLGGQSYAFDERLFFSVGVGAFADIDGDGSIEAFGARFNNAFGYDQRVGPLGFAWYDTSRDVQRWTGFVRGSAWMDADGDGDKDLVVYGEDVGTSWYENEGAGSFARAATFEGPGDIRKLVGAYDLNGDGFEDMLVELLSTSGLAVRLYHGPQTYDPPVTISSADGLGLEDLTPSDLDADGDLDLFHIQRTLGGLRIFTLLNSGTGTSFPRQLIAQTPAFDLASAVIFDIDGDGDDDLVTLRIGQAKIYLNDGAGAFAPPIFHFAADIPFYFSTTFDVDGDGDEDIVARNQAEPWMWSPQGPSPTIAPFIPLGIPGTEDATELVQVDLNLDGLADLVAIGGPVAEGNADTILLADGMGGFLAPERIGAPNPRSYRTSLLDIDSDGDIDAFSSLDANTLLVHLNAATPMAGTVPEICSSAAENSSGRMGQLTAYGDAALGSSNLSLVAYRLPENQFGLFVGSLTLTNPTPVTGSLGSICLGGAIGRYDAPSEVQSSGAQGSFRIPLDPGALETSSGAVPASVGETWYFQAWHRDLTQGGAPTNNFTSALGLTFTP